MWLGQLAGARRKQILLALNDNGPLSVEILAKIIRPRMSARSVQYAIKRLRERQLVVPHFGSAHYNAGHFFRITHDLEGRERIAKWLNLPTWQLRQPKFFSKELEHSVQCDLWEALLRDKFADAEILRDIQLLKRKLKQSSAPMDQAQADLVPDLLVQFRSARRDDSVSVGVEIERTRKSERRLAIKLYKIIARTQLDGLIYVCEDGKVKDAIRAVLARQKILESPRIRHYGNAFLLFADAGEIHRTDAPTLFNVEGKGISLLKWTTALRKISANFRRESNFFSS